MREISEGDTAKEAVNRLSPGAQRRETRQPKTNLVTRNPATGSQELWTWASQLGSIGLHRASFQEWKAWSTSWVMTMAIGTADSGRVHGGRGGREVGPTWEQCI